MVDQAANIAGWMTYRELVWLAKQAKKHRVIVEIGSYQGRSTRALGDHTTGVVYAVDDFHGPRDTASLGLPVLELFLHNLYDLIALKRVIPVVSDHGTELELHPDMVFIDGSHEYADVKRDISLWLPKVAPGGLICGHDITFSQVAAAVGELVDYRVARGTTIWYKRVVE